METLLIQWLTIMVLALLIGALLKINQATDTIQNHILPNVTDTVSSVKRSVGRIEDDIVPDAVEAIEDIKTSTTIIKWLLVSGVGVAAACLLKDKFK